MPTPPSCKDCGSATRPLKFPGPRCHTCWGQEKKRRKAAKHRWTVENTYNLTEGQYEELYLFQGGCCAICQRATGKTKRLAVDHSHVTEEVRGLLCSVCNSTLAHARDDPQFFHRAYHYLMHPPAMAMKEVKQWPQPPSE